FERTDMPLQPCLRAQSSAAASNNVPAPRLRCPSATTSPFTSARISTSRSGCLLTCVQPITPYSRESATNTACCEAGLIPTSLLRICAAVAGYPSWPESTAIRGASALFARRMFNFLSLLLDVIGLKSPSAANGIVLPRSSIHAAHPRRSTVPRAYSGCGFFPRRELLPGSMGYFSCRYFAAPSSPLSSRNFFHRALPARSPAGISQSAHSEKPYPYS